MPRPRLLDLFCGAGGAGMGYYRAGFDVVGVDIRPQPRYPFDFIQGDALEYLRSHGHEFDAIHASPPCQAYSVARNTHGKEGHPDLVGPTRELLRTTGIPYVIENVPGAPLENPVTVCGLALGLNVKRHRLFESDVMLFGTPCVRHDGDYLVVFGGAPRTRCKTKGRTEKGGPICHRGTAPIEEGRRAMGVNWEMSGDELSQAIPPAYTEHIGRQIINAVEAGATPC